MPVFGQVGLMGSGKTRQIVKTGLRALADGRDVYANFQLGRREPGWLVPICGRSVHYSASHVAERYEFQPRSWLNDLYGAERGWRFGRGFVSHDRAQLLTSWDQLIALRVGRDEFGKAHRLRVLESGGEFYTEKMCAIHDCAGCSKGITVLIDELNLWAPSRLWEQLGIGVLNRWAYARKDGLEVHWSSQHEARIDKVAREVTDHIWTNNSIGGTFRGFRFQIFQRRRWVPALMSEKNRVISGEGAHASGAAGGFEWPEFVVRFGSNLSTKDEEAFDTYEHVQASGHLSARGGPRSAGAARRSA